MTMSKPGGEQGDRWRHLAAALVAAVAMLLVGSVYLLSAVLVPVWALLPLWILWLVLTGYGVALARRSSYRVLAVPAVASAIWLLIVTLGVQFLHWDFDLGLT